jgi:glucose-6-phosphate isomerase
MEFLNFDELEAYKKLLSLENAVALPSILSAERVKKYSIPMAEGLVYNYAAKEVNAQVLSVLQDLSDEASLVEKFKLLYEGEVMNTGENRKVLHHLTRGQLGAPVLHEGEDLFAFYTEQQRAIANFASDVHAGKITNEKGESFTTVIQIGIGGSDLGPRAMYLALEQWARAAGKQKMKALFISNVDPDDAAAVMASVDMSRSLFILVSKSGTTQETLANELFVKDFLKKANLNPAKHMLAVTSKTSPLANNPDYLKSFYIDDFIGGRYSSTSAVGGAVLSLALGAETFAQFLAGAHEADKTAKEKNIEKNPALMDALIGIYERNVQGYPATAVLPYSQALSRFPAHLQQADMESNGKGVNRFAQPISYQTGPLLFGEPGTNGQHSFYQLLHQGTAICPLQFIGFKESQAGKDIEVQNSTSQEKLNANLAAQIVAFARGTKNENPNKNFSGGRPSSLILGKSLSPRSLGALLAHFENKIMFQGFVWNINSFDQEGVQLGKVLTQKVLSKDMDEVLASYAALFDLA